MVKKEPRWKHPKTKEERSKKRKPTRKTKHVRATQDSAWLNLKNYFEEIRLKTCMDFGFSYEEALKYTKTGIYPEI
jgi:hypothetical protein